MIWGPYTRRYWAFACWPLPEGGLDAEQRGRATVFGYYVNDPERFGVLGFGEGGQVVSASDPDELYTEMRRVEREGKYLKWRYGRRQPQRRTGS